jgi:hypothetical protein
LGTRRSGWQCQGTLLCHSLRGFNAISRLILGLKPQATDCHPLRGLVGFWIRSWGTLPRTRFRPRECNSGHFRTLPRSYVSAPSAMTAKKTRDYNCSKPHPGHPRAPRVPPSNGGAQRGILWVKGLPPVRAPLILPRPRARAAEGVPRLWIGKSNPQWPPRSG